MPDAEPTPQWYGAWLMDSAPPTRATLASPARMVCAADTAACSPDPHSRLTVSAGVSTGTPAYSAMWRARYGASFPVWMTLPTTTSSTAAAGTPVRSKAARAAATPRSTAEMSCSAPPKVPKGVLAPPRIRTSSTQIPSPCAVDSIHSVVVS